MKTTTDSPIMINPQRSIGGLYHQITVEENHVDELEITDHPVESGASISDHAFKKPERVSITAATSATNEDIDAAYNKLLELQAKREPFEIVTGKRSYQNMLIESLRAPTNRETENALWFTADCKEVRIVGLATATLPPAENQQMPGKTGETSDAGGKQAEPVEINQSALSRIFGN